jgi:FKBP-type peptidyl-prolyl cis-trans isomerase FkpA
MKKNKQFLVAALGLIMASCGTGTKKTPSGVEYIIHKQGSGAQLKLGDTVLLNVVQRLNDSIMGTSRERNNNQPVPALITKPMMKWDLMDGLASLHVGDSATFIIPIDSLPEPRPPFGKKGDKLKITFSVVDKYSAAKQAEEDEKIIKDYLTKNNLKATQTNGVYIATQTEGTGVQPQAGDTVAVMYTGKLLDGKVFDSNMDTSRPGPHKPIEFAVGRGFVIKGWDLGISALKKGAKATLVIPSGLAYGLQGNMGIPSNSVLVFDVELVDVKAPKAGATDAAPSMGTMKPAPAPAKKK